MRREHVAGAEQPERLAVVRIERDGLFEQGLRHDMVLPRHAPVMRERAHQEIPGVHAVGRLALGAKILGGIELRLDRGDDRLRDLVLHREDVGELAVVTFGPEMAAGGDVVELRGDADAVAVLADAALDDIAHAELFRDLTQMNRAALVDEARVACDHEQPSQPREAGDDVFGDPIGEVFVLGVAAHVGKGEDGDGWFVR